MLNKILALAIIASSVAAICPATSRAAETDWPQITSPETKAWTRWWWHGSQVTKADLTAAMETYGAADLGGLELTPIYGVRGEEDQFIDYLSPRWMDMLEHVLREADRLGMEIDMATGNGWPFGGPWVGGDAACKTLVLQTYEVDGGKSLDEPVRCVQKPMVRAIGRRVNISDLKEPIGENADLQGMALEQVRFEKPLPLVALVAYGDGSPIDLTAHVGSDGKLDWQAPPGNWTLYAVFQGWHGKFVERAGPGGEGDVIDHFNRDALSAYLKKFDDAFAGRDIKGLRGFFNDSYEVDDASGNADFTPRMFDEFQRRRGYDLRAHLPALFGKASADENARVLCDYRETISDLLLDEFTKPWGEWAHKYGAITRNQAHGSPANILDLYAASGIPETEGTDRIKFISAASAAHVTGQKLVSAEACTWMNEHFIGTLADAKRWVDDYFLGGVNHICYHGSCYSPESESWPGRLFYASFELQPTNPSWAHFHALNEYVARCQSFLQAGSPDSDVLVYYPIHDEWAQRGRSTLAHFSGDAGVSSARQLGEQLLAEGVLFDFISDRQLQTVDAIDWLAAPPGDVHTRAIMIPSCKTMPIESLRKLAKLATDGAAIVLPPGEWSPDVSGLGQLEERRAEARELVAKIRARAKSTPATATQAQMVDGAESMTKKGLQFIRRRHDDGHSYFIVNAAAKRFDDWIEVRKAAAAVLFDPVSGETGFAAVKLHPTSNTGIRVQLDPAQTCIVRTYDRVIKGREFPYVDAPGEPIKIDRAWKLTFVDGGPTLPDAVETPALKSWTEFDGDAVKNFSGIGSYTIEFPTPKAKANAWVLDLGVVHETAEVRLNGESIATLFAAPFRVRIPADKLKANNTLEIDVANLMANRIADLDRREVPWKKFYNVNFAARRGENRGPDGLFSAAKWKPLPSGLIGPVTLTPLGVGAAAK